MRLSGCKECPLEQDGRGRSLERASADSKQRAHKRWTEMSIIVHYPNISKLSNSTYMTWHMNTYDTYHIGNIIYTSRSYYDHNVINYIWSLSFIVHIPLYVSTQLHNITTMTLKIHRVTALKISGGNNPQHSSGASQPPRGGSSTPGMA